MTIFFIIMCVMHYSLISQAFSNCIIMWTFYPWFIMWFDLTYISYCFAHLHFNVPPSNFVFANEMSQPRFWEKVRMTLTFPKMGTWESSGTPETSELDCRGQNTLPWGVFHIIEKLPKCRCRKWPRMSHLDICSTSYGQKKGRESNASLTPDH